jgi:hypothetical protein
MRLSVALGYHLYTIGDYRPAHPYYERAFAFCEKQLGPEYPDTATSLNDLAALLQAQESPCRGSPAQSGPRFAIKAMRIGSDSWSFARPVRFLVSMSVGRSSTRSWSEPSVSSSVCGNRSS